MTPPEIRSSVFAERGMAFNGRKLSAEARRAHGRKIKAGMAAAKSARPAPPPPAARPPGAPAIDNPVTWMEQAAKVRAEKGMEELKLQRIERETLERQRIPIAEVQAWCDALVKRLGTILASVGGLPAPTPAQTAWLNEWERRVRNEIVSGGP